MTDIKIYQCGPDWYAAKNLRDAVREAVYNTGMSIREALEDIELVPDKELDRLRFLDDVYDEANCTKRSFREQLKLMIEAGERFPAPFATSEW